MPRARPNSLQNLLAGVILPLLSTLLVPVSLLAVAVCLVCDWFKGRSAQDIRSRRAVERGRGTPKSPGCVIISGGRMSKGLTLARAFKRAGWKVVGVEEEGWGELCPMRFSSAIDAFHLLPPAANSYDRYRDTLISIAQSESATLFIPVSGAGSSVEDARAAETMSTATKGKCRTFIQDPTTMLDLHDKDRFMALVKRLGFTIPTGQLVEDVDQAIGFLGSDKGKGKEYILKCLGLDENRGDMTLFPLHGDEGDRILSRTRRLLQGLATPITVDCPYVFQEFIPGPEWCTHASVVDGRLTSFVACPSNDMLMTYENGTYERIGRRAEQWTRDFLQRLAHDPISNQDGGHADGSSSRSRRLTGHFSFDFIVSTKNDEMYPIECNARVHTAIIMLPLSKIADCYSSSGSVSGNFTTLRPDPSTSPRSWIYNDLMMRYLPLVLPSRPLLGMLHPSLPATVVEGENRRTLRPREGAWIWRKDPTLAADDWVPFLVLWHLYWPSLLLGRWWNGQRWTRLNVSTGRIFEA